ncbi:Polarized growth protein rax2 [Golovinomyces cichoracearum]|uniref:Polarized growth protein rax2 n=1 Tax=Golovinomyces cichoracearum TaxID=62708 RepID=A0A420HKW1_9PEZI|nr:Polarized growth protein rax2 [Golovinomyces cichoracearum]
MKIYSLLSPSASFHQPKVQILLILLAATQLGSALTFKKAPAANLNLGNLGRTAFTGDFTGISFYEYEGPSENTLGKNGSQSLLQRMPDGRFASVASSDAGIQAICFLKVNEGKSYRVIVGGDFTDLGGVQSPGIAIFNPETSVVKPLIGLSGQVSALYCDESTNTVYAGGSFKTANSMNAVQLIDGGVFQDLPFDGFNGPVNSITKAPNGNIIFGGSFTGLGNTTVGLSLPDQIVINLSEAKITSGSSSSVPGFNDPFNIVCKSTGRDGLGDTWLLNDNTPGFWRADFGYHFRPTRLRLWNTHFNSRGSRIFRYTAFPINGIMNLTYIDPITKQTNYCTSECPLSDDTNILYQDFHFVNVISMNAFQIDISGWYGDGGGFSGIELTHDDIDSYAINAFNEPACLNTTTVSTVSTTGPWSVSPSAQSSSEYLSISSTAIESASVVFLPNIRQPGNYSINMYTPGCEQDRTCEGRGRINITGVMSKQGNNEVSFSTEIFQTNNYDKYDQIYFGYIDAISSSFRPSVTITLAPGQDSQNLTIVAQRVGFTLVSPSGGLNGVFEYDPKQSDITPLNIDDISPFDSVGKKLPSGAEVNVLKTFDETTYIGGDFMMEGFNNIFKITNNTPQSLAGDGLNGAVRSILINGNSLIVGGNFSDLALGGNKNLSKIATYDTLTNLWSSLGAGVNDAVLEIVPLQMNITKNKPETTIALTGKFTQVLGFDGNPSFITDGFAIWVPSANNWLQNLDIPKLKIDGTLTTAIDLPDGVILFAGSVTSSQLSAVDVAEINSSGTSLQSFPVKIQQSIMPRFILRPAKSSVSSISNSTEVVAGLFYIRNSNSIVILGGHFSAIDSNGSEVNNIVFIDGAKGNFVSGIGPSLSNDSKILAMEVHKDTLFAGGSLTGIVNGASTRGLISYNLDTSRFEIQPPSLDGDVFSITSRQFTDEVYVGGSFTSAGSLSCPAVCQYSTINSQWNRIGNGLSGVVNKLLWANPNLLIAGGNLTLNDVAASLVTYDTKSLTWSVVAGSESIPGPVNSITKANNDASHLWVSGYALNGTVFLMKFDSKSWTPISHLLEPGTQVKGLQVLGTTSNHASSGLVSSGSILLVTGSIKLPEIGYVSAALFNGSSFQPYILTSSLDGPGSLTQFFAEKEVTFQLKDGNLARGFVVLISLAIALGLIMIILVAGLLVERLRKKEEGYSPAPTSNYERGIPIASRVPPEQLLESISQGGRKKIDNQATYI